MDWLKKARIATPYNMQRATTLHHATCDADRHTIHHATWIATPCNMQHATTLHHATWIASPCSMQRRSLHHATCNADRYTMQHATRIAAPLCNAQPATYNCAQSRLAALPRCRQPTGQSSPPRQRWACTARSPRAAVSPGADVAVPSRSPGADVGGMGQSRCRCGRDGPVPSRSPGADVSGGPTWQRRADWVAHSLQDLQGPREGVAQCAVGVLATGALPTATSAPGLGSPLPHLHEHWARPCHICTGTGLTAATSALGLGSPLPHLHCDWAHSCHICSAMRLGSPPATSARRRAVIVELCNQ
jgi:hypothetical protein